MLRTDSINTYKKQHRINRSSLPSITFPVSRFTRSAVKENINPYKCWAIYEILLHIKSNNANPLSNIYLILNCVFSLNTFNMLCKYIGYVTARCKVNSNCIFIHSIRAIKLKWIKKTEHNINFNTSSSNSWTEVETIFLLKIEYGLSSFLALIIENRTK